MPGMRLDKPPMVVLLVLSVGLAVVAACGKKPEPAPTPVPGSYAGKLLGGLNKTAVERTRGDMQNYRTAIEAYQIDNSQYPEASSREALEALVTPTYIRMLPQFDAWAGPFHVESTATSYKIIAAGADGLVGTDDDIVLEPKGFTHLPQGFQ